jgi:hypothetical protein
MIADRRLYLTADRKTLVEEGDPSAAFLFVAAGDHLDEDEARRLGWPPPKADATTELIDMDEVLRKAQVEPEAKALHEPPETKQIIPPEVKRTPRLVKRRKTNG